MMALSRRPIGVAVNSARCRLQCRPIRGSPSIFDGQWRSEAMKLTYEKGDNYESDTFSVIALV
jgi:hypothetical protein